MRTQTSQKAEPFACAPMKIILGVFAIFLCAVIFFSSTLHSSAATLSTVNFQARLESNTGAIAPDGNYNIRFKLYSASTGGSALWTETYQNSASQGITVTNGYVTVNLGSLTAFSGINWDQDLYLTMDIGGTSVGASPTYDGEMTPRLKLTAVPYAFRAGQLSKLTGANTSTLDFDTQTGARSILLPDESGTICIQNSANCGFLTGAAASGSYVQLQGSTPGTAQTGNFNISGTGIAGILQAATINATTVFKLNGTSGSTTTCSGGNVLQNAVVQGGIITGGTCVANGGGTTGVTLQGSTPGTPDTGNFNVTGTGIAGILQAASFDRASSGALNIGVTNATSISLGQNTTLASGKTLLVQGAATFKNASNSTNAFEVQNSGGGSVLNVDTSSGYVGIGTVSPAAQLHIRSTTTAAYAFIDGVSDGDNYSTLELRNNAGDSKWQFSNKSVTGRVKSFEVNHYDGTSWTTPFAITNIGQVGINNTAPGYALDVTGTINATTAYRINGTLGSTTTCSSGDVLQNAVIVGGIITGGSCVANGGGAIASLTLAGTSGTNQTITNSDTITLAAGTNISTTGGATDTVTIAVVNAPSFSGVITSTVATGTAPFTVASTTKVTNLNADTLDGIDSTGFAAASGSANYIQNQNASAQTTSNFWISGTGKANLLNSVTGYQFNGTSGSTTTCSSGNVLQNAVIQGGIITGGTCVANGGGFVGVTLQGSTPGTADTGNFNVSGTGIADILQGTTKVLTPLLDTVSAGTLNIGTTNATQINLNKNVVVAASQYITLVGGITSTRPVTPADGTLYYDQTTKTLLVYANSRWQSYGGNAATKIVGTSASGGASSAVASQSPDGADYINASTTSAQTVINNAITALPANGGTVYLMDGTYIIDGSISVPSNVTLMGAGAATIIKVKNATNLNFNIIQNSDSTNGNTNVIIRDLKIDGNGGNQTSNNEVGISFTKVGSGTGGSGRSGGRIEAVDIENLGYASPIAMYLNISSNVIITANTFVGTGYQIQLNSSTFNTISNNVIVGQGLANQGVVINSGSTNNNIVNNVIRDVGGSGISLSANSNTITGNSIYTSNYGMNISGASNNVISSNYLEGNGTYGMYFSGSSNTNTVTGNKLYNNAASTANSSIAFVSSSNNTITGNDITDTAGTGAAISLDSASASNYLSANRYSGTGAATISDSSATTVYAGQLDGNGTIVNKNVPALTVGTSVVSSTLSVQGGITTSALPSPAAPTVAKVGASGGATYTYAVSAQDGTGETLIGSTASATSAANPINGTNYNTITWAQISGATSYKVYRTAVTSGSPSTTGVIATTTATGAATYTVNDTGLAGSGSTPAVNTTAGGIFAGALQGGSSLTLGTSSSRDANIIFKNATNANAVTIISGATSTSYQLTLPTGLGSSGYCLKDTNGAGVLGFAACTTSGVTLQATTPGTADTGNFNVSGTGIADILQGTTKVYTPLIDTAAAGTLSIGTSNASALTISSNGTISTLNGQLVIGNTSTVSNSKLLISGTLNSSTTGSQYGFQNNISINPQGASLTNAYGFTNNVNLTGSSLNITGLFGGVAGIQTSAGYTGLVAAGYGLQVAAPTIGGSQKITNYYGLSVVANSANGGNTSGTIGNYQMRLYGNTAAAGAGGTVNNYTAYLEVPSGSGAGTTNNYGLYLNGAGGGSSVYSLYNNSSALSYFAGSLQGNVNILTPIVDTASAGALTVGNTNATSIALGKTSSNIQTTINGTALFKPTTGNDSATAFQIQNAGGTTMVNVNSTTGALTLSGTTNTTQFIVKAAASQTAANPLIVLQTSGGTELARLTADGNGNSFFGTTSGGGTGASRNTAVGYQTLRVSATGGDDNTAIGYNALTAVTTGNSNTAVGSSALAANTNNNNTAVGYNALANNTSGFYQTALGAYAGNGYTTGSHNISIGEFSGNADQDGFVTVDGLQNANALGSYSQVQASNSMVLGGIGSNATNVGIGTTIPLNVFSVSPIDYSTGTASQSTNTVTGVGTTWTAAMVGDQFIFLNGKTGTVTGFTDATHLTLSTSQTVSSQKYRLHVVGFQVTSAGTAYLQNTSTTAFKVQNAGASVLLTADTSNMQVVVGSTTNGVILSSTGLQLKGTARNAKVITLTAEYGGAVLDAGTGSNNSGTMTSGIDLTNRMNYYKWTTTQGSNQSYDVDIQVPVPSDFDSWNSNPVSITTYTSDTTNGTITLEARDTGGTVRCNFVAVTPGSTTTWTANNSACTLSSGTYTAGGYMTFRIRLQSPNAGDVRIGNIVLSYLSKY